MLKVTLLLLRSCFWATVVPGGPGSLGFLGCSWSIPGNCLQGLFTSSESSHCVHVIHEFGGLCHYSFFSEVRGWGGGNPETLQDAGNTSSFFWRLVIQDTSFLGQPPLQFLFPSNLGWYFFLLGLWRLSKKLFSFFSDTWMTLVHFLSFKGLVLTLPPPAHLRNHFQEIS